MNEDNITAQDQAAEPPAASESVPQGGAAVRTEAPAADKPAVDDYAERAAETEKQIAMQQEQDQKLLAALDEVLEKRSRQMTREQQKRPPTRSERAAAAVARKGVGFVSLGLILVFMGIVMIVTLFSKAPNYTLPLKLSPICAIMMGAEILVTHAVSRGKMRVSVPSLLASVALVVGCCVLCAKLGGDYKEETVEYNNRTIAGEIYDQSYDKLKGIADITAVKVSVNLNPDGTGKLKGVEALSAGDIVNIDVELGGIFNSPKNFAADCKRIIDSYHVMGINVTDFHFKNRSKLRSYTLDVEGKYAQDLDESRLEEMVNYVYIDDYDYIEDLEDYTESEPTSSNG